MLSVQKTMYLQNNRINKTYAKTCFNIKLALLLTKQQFALIEGVFNFLTLKKSSKSTGQVSSFLMDSETETQGGSEIFLKS